MTSGQGDKGNTIEVTRGQGDTVTRGEAEETSKVNGLGVWG